MFWSGGNGGALLSNPTALRAGISQALSGKRFNKRFYLLFQLFHLKWNKMLESKKPLC